MPLNRQHALPQVVQAREANCTLEVFGAVLADSFTAATVVRRNAITDIQNALDSAAALFGPVIRHPVSAAVEARAPGILAHELDDRVEATT